MHELNAPGKNQDENKNNNMTIQGKNLVNTIVQEFQHFMWTQRIPTLTNAVRQQPFKLLANMQPPEVSIPAWLNDVNNVSPITNYDTLAVHVAFCNTR